MRCVITRGSAAGALFLVLLAASAASAQIRQPIPPFAIDIRGFYTGLGQDARTASELGLTVDDLPTRSLGAVAGIHFYPLRGRRMSLGIGGEYLRARGRRTPEPPANSTVLPTTPVVEQRLVSLSPQVSLNFGHRDGWSYVTAGMGPLSLETFTGSVAPAEAPEKKNTINMGGGARWFASSHVAFTFDVRFYLTRPADTTLSHPGRDRNRLRILSAGISIR
jgi:hypothetical protein